MSIIHDALKKTQVNLKKNEKASAPSDHLENQKKSDDYSPIIKPADTTNIQTKRPDKLKIAIICISLIAAGFLVSIFLPSANKSSTATKKIEKIKKTSSRPNATTNFIPNATPFNGRSSNQKSLTLNGTIMAENKKAALINNEIYQVGEFVNGKAIHKISLKKVELIDKNGKITILKIKK